jgi:hypothetical protein
MPHAAVSPDYERLRKALPYEIVPTSLPGVYTSPAPPADLDFNRADAETLAKHGVLWRRPEAKEWPTMRAAWDRVTSRKWKQIVPEMEVQFGTTHTIAKSKKTENVYPSREWAGGVVDGPLGSYTSAIGFWHVPTVKRPPQQAGFADGGWDSRSFVGIDGFSNEDRLQTGVMQNVDASFNASYIPYFRWYVPGADETRSPYINAVPFLNFSVSPGDEVYGSVQYVGTTAAQVYLANDTTGDRSPALTLEPPKDSNGNVVASFAGSSAEWIMEVPDGGEPEHALPSFNGVDFTSAIACNRLATVVGNPENGDKMLIFGVPSGLQLTGVTLVNEEVLIDFLG